VDLFKAQPFGTDQRGRYVELTLMFTSMAIGAIPRMGKTFAVRELLLIAALDARAEIHVYDNKGTGDLSPLECVAHRYGVGDERRDRRRPRGHARAAGRTTPPHESDPRPAPGYLPREQGHPGAGEQTLPRIAPHRHRRR
jgi:hypothetical protein